VEGITKARRGEVQITPGYDGEYGKIGLFTEEQ
jgi:PHP family Zn ribbon phosphoesterase